jgi:Fibronectin type III domain
MLGTARATQWGYSLFEFQVFGTSGGGGTCATLPGAPTGLSAPIVSSTSVTLSWTAPNPGTNCTITSYRVFRDGVQVATPAGTSALISGLTANTTYSLTVVAVNAFGAGPQSSALSVTTTGGSSNPNFGPNVVIFDPSMPMSSIQSQINSIFAVQQNNQFGTPRTAILFKPGNYNVDIPIGFFTHIIGLGAFPDDVTVSNVHSDAVLPNFNGTQNFWRGVENFSVTPPGAGMKWAVSQACPFRRMHIRGNNLNLHDNFGWVSGGWISDSSIDFDVGSISQQQWISRNAQWGSWTGNVWNMVFVGIPNNLPGGVWPTAANTFINPTPISREKPFLWLNGANYEVYVPNLRTNTNGITWGAGQTPGTSIPLDQFYVARAGIDTAATMNAALNAGLNLLLTPGIYDLNVPIQVNRPNAIVMGMGYATLRSTAGNAVLTTADVDGVKLSHIFVDAGAINSPVLVQIGPPGSNANHAANPITIHDLFIRIGGATVGRASISLQINSNNTLLDHTWLWRADHGNAGTVGWDINTAANGLVVNGNNVTAYGLFVEHFQEYQTIWNGNGGRTYFYQSEIPYDPPQNRQDLWTSAPGVNGWASYKVADSVTSHEAWGMGIYAVFLVTGQRLTRAIETPVNSNVRFHHMVTVNLTVNGGIDNVINNTGGGTAPGIAVNTPRVTDFP